jgi:hypothetical protein
MRQDVADVKLMLFFLPCSLPCFTTHHALLFLQRFLSFCVYGQGADVEVFQVHACRLLIGSLCVSSSGANWALLLACVNAACMLPIYVISCL